MKNPVLLASILVVLAIAAGGCTSQAPAASETPVQTTVAVPLPSGTPAAPVLGAPPEFFRNWTCTGMMVRQGTLQQLPAANITLTFGTGGVLFGSGGCNRYFGTYELLGETPDTGHGISIRSIGSTKMFCDATSGQEETYLSILKETAGYSLDITADELTLIAPSGNRLVFRGAS